MNLLNIIASEDQAFGQVASMLEIHDETFQFQPLSLNFEYNNWNAQWELMNNNDTHKFLPRYQRHLRFTVLPV